MKQMKYHEPTRGVKDECTVATERWNSLSLINCCRLEDLVKKQGAELQELRQRIHSGNTTSTSGRGSLTPESCQESTAQVSSASSPERATAFCHRGTDPLYEWPERPSTCTRSTSPLFFSVLSMNSHEESHESLLADQELAEENSDTLKDDVVREKTTVNCSSGLYILVRDFRRVYKRGVLYPRGLITGIKKHLATTYNSVDQNTFCIYWF